MPRPKNLVLFIGDGLGLTTVTASRIYKGQSRFGLSGEEASLLWEGFPEVALLKVVIQGSSIICKHNARRLHVSQLKTSFVQLGFSMSKVTDKKSS